MIEEFAVIVLVLVVASIVVSLKAMMDLGKLRSSESRLKTSLEREFLEMDRRVSGLMRMCMDHDVRLGLIEVKKGKVGRTKKEEWRTVSLNETELRILEFLKGGEMTAKMVIESLGKSREHTSRMLKGLYEKGLVVRDEGKRPYTYRLTKMGMEVLRA